MAEDNVLLLREDLAKSGLVVDDVLARPLDSHERAAAKIPFHVPGYVLPYFSISGRPLSFYRCRLFDYEPKYKQVGDTPNHIYYPRAFARYIGTKPYVIITEGEKKAAAACKAGFPAIGLGGVDSWRNRIITLPADTALDPGKNDTVKAKLPGGGAAVTDEYQSNFAEGFQEFIDLVLKYNFHVIICYDSDEDGELKASVQRAAAGLAFELRYKGIAFDHIRQLILPKIEKVEYTNQKVGIDDYIQAEGAQRFNLLLDRLMRQPSAFPKHPNIREYVSQRLQRKQITRKEQQNVALAILSDLDTSGARYRAESGLVHYFDKGSKRLFRAEFPVTNFGGFESQFIQFLYSHYGLSSADRTVLVWLGTQFSAEPPIGSVSPYRIVARPEEPQDVAFLQVSDSRFVSISSEQIKIHDNGVGGILFESGQVEPVNEQVFSQYLDALHVDENEKMPNWWGETLSDVRLRDKDRQRVATSLLYYMSPFLFRWRGMQLPVELITGESGSGKSTLCELRLSILTGRAHLRNAPNDLKDWHASVANTGGLHVTDNVQMTDANLRQRLSDEICRLVTEPNPSIEQRKYYTNADIVRFPVRTVFAITAIRQPFTNADLIQRSMLLEFDKSTDSGIVTYDSNWKSQQLKRHGGREAWLAHHCLVLQRFFQLVKKHWKHTYQAKYRLIHFEQAMMMMAQVFGLPTPWVVEYLSGMTQIAISESDWVLEGLQAYCNQDPSQIPPLISVTEIALWAGSEEEYMKCDMLTNTRKLGRYLIQHKSLVQAATGLTENKKINNKLTYKLIRRPQKRSA